MAKETLIVCYSRTGTTKRVASYLAATLDADIDFIREPESREGRFGYVRSALEAIARGVPAIETERDPRRYNLVVVGTPVWFGSMSSPVRAYLYAHAGQLHNAAFFATMGGRGGEATVREMQLASRSTSAPTCVLTQREVERDHYANACAGFVRTLRAIVRATNGAGLDDVKHA